MHAREPYARKHYGHSVHIIMYICTYIIPTVYATHYSNVIVKRPEQQQIKTTAASACAAACSKWTRAHAVCSIAHICIKYTPIL